MKTPQVPALVDLPDCLNRKLHPELNTTDDERRELLGVVEAKPVTTDDRPRVRLMLQGIRSTRRRHIPDGWHDVIIAKRGRKWVEFLTYGRRVRMHLSQFNSIKERSEMISKKGTVMLSTEDNDAGLVPASKAKAEAQALADETGASVTVRDPISDKVLKTVKPKQGAKKMQTSPSTKTTAKPKVAPVKKAKAKKPAKAKTNKRASDKQTTTDELVRLAQRPNGVTPAELNETSGWTGAPWKWLFENSKGTGWSQRRGLKFKVVKKDGETRYHLTK